MSARYSGCHGVGGVAGCDLTVRLDWKPSDDSNQRLGRYSKAGTNAVVNKSG
jgi:hypothetical protein